MIRSTYRRTSLQSSQPALDAIPLTEEYTNLLEDAERGEAELQEYMLRPRRHRTKNAALSRRAKLARARHKGSYLKGARKFARSAAGRALAIARGRFNAIHHSSLGEEDDDAGMPDDRDLMAAFQGELTNANIRFNVLDDAGALEIPGMTMADLEMIISKFAELGFAFSDETDGDGNPTVLVAFDGLADAEEE